MPNNNHPISKLDFFLGTWNLEYRVPESLFSKVDKGSGTGEFKRILNDEYVTFDYKAKLSSIESSSHAVFAWDEKSKTYRYWWFESSGNFLTASCNFINDDTLSLNWHDSLLVQTFKKESVDKIILQMKYPVSDNKYEIVLEVIFTRK
ncbi:MAG: DUF1579 family protein [Ignavibacteriaceae bacterium]|jgi:hypothetical protein